MEVEKLNLGELETQQGGFNFAGKGISSIISDLIPYFFAGAGILLLLYLLFGGLQLMLSRGDPKAVQDAKGKITNAFIGFLIVFTAYWLVQIVGQLLGLQQTSFGEPFNLQ